MEKRKTILLIDDDCDFLEQMKIILTSEGYKIVTADGMKSGVKMLEDFKPDLVMVDLMMEHYDSGFIVSYEVKDKYPDVPVILATAVAAETGSRFSLEEKSASSWAKADLIMDKGIRHDQLIREVKRLLVR